MHKDGKKHRTAKTSLKCYDEIKNTDLIPSQKIRVLNAFTKFSEAIDYRTIMSLTGMEAGSVGRTINQLLTFGKIQKDRMEGNRGYYKLVTD